MTETAHIEDPAHSMEGNKRRNKELARLFGEETVEQACLLDIADMNLTDEIAASIANGVNQLKKLRDDPDSQKEFIDKMRPGARILLCMWIMDMDILEKIQNH